MNSHRLLTILLVGMLLSACTQFTPYRSVTPPQSADSRQEVHEWRPECAVDKGRVINDKRELCEDRNSDSHALSPAIQHRFYQTQDEQEGDYYLSFVEFDDQGWFADRRQMEALFALLNNLEKKTDGHFLIQVYAHGWKHNASACDNNVLCFSRLLERTDLAEKNKEVFRYMEKGIPKLLEELKITEEKAKELNDEQKTMLLVEVMSRKSKMKDEELTKELSKIKPRTVVGVYLGWRGLPFGTALNNLSFWSRKDTAARVGSGGVFELLTRLKDYRDIRQSDDSADTNKTQLVITGHSFGGHVIYSALSHALMERATKTWRPLKAAAAEYGIAKSFGDFVLLVNPAFEGSLYEPLFNIATNRCYKETQRPVMMIVTSTADKATDIAFPIGRAMDTLFQHKGSAEQGDSMRKTIGHNERYKTHDLKLSGDRNTLDDKYVAKSACDCPHLRPTSELTLDQMQGDSFNAMVSDNYGPGLSLVPVVHPKEKTDPGQSANPKYTRNYPYLVVTTDASVIADHNAIYNGNFTLFAHQFFQKHIALERPLPPASGSVQCWPKAKVSGGLLPIERSCQLDDAGKSCTWQTLTN